MRFSLVRKSLAVLGALTPAIASSAQGTWYTAAEYGTDVAARTAWLQAAGGARIDWFDDLVPHVNTTSPLTRLSGDLTVSTSRDHLWAYNLGGKRYLGTENEGVDMRFDFNAPFTSFAGWFNASDVNGFQVADTFGLSISDGSNRNFLGTARTDTFVGYIGTSNVADFTLSAGDPLDWINVRGFMVGTSAVPEPGEWAAMGVLGAGLAALVLRRRRA